MTKRKSGLPAVKGQGPDGSTQLVTGFAPVPRQYRYDGWTPERQKAFIAALAETGCVTRAAAMVNMAQANCYTLRRAPGAEEFRRAWDAALDFGLKRLKDIAFERAVEGYLVPVFVGGKLMGFRRKYNDALLMFCLRHYGQDSSGKRVTVNYFSTRASAGSVLRDGTSTMGSHQSTTLMGGGSAPPQDERIADGTAAEASTTTVRTVITGPAGANDPSTGSGQAAAGRLDEAAAVLEGFEGVALDAEAEAAIRTALEDCAARARAARAALDEGGEAALDAAEALGNAFVRVPPGRLSYRGTLEFPSGFEEIVPFAPGEEHWSLAGAEMPEGLARLTDEAEAEEAKRACGDPGRRKAGRSRK
jgi:hypothetical protein